MAAKILGAVVASGVLAFGLGYVIADQKIFGGATPSTVASNKSSEATEKRFLARLRTAGLPVVMSPIYGQTFIVRSCPDWP